LAGRRPCRRQRRGPPHLAGPRVPAGSGIYRYAEIDIEPPAGYEAPPPRVKEPVTPLHAAVGVLGDEE
jgi:hypothetical protein